MAPVLTQALPCLIYPSGRMMQIMWHMDIVPDYCLLACAGVCQPTSHTGLIGSKSFQNYLKGCISLKTLKLWLLVMTKHFFNGHTYKVDIGQHFHKSEKNHHKKSKQILKLLYLYY